ncbi:MAG: ABC transporter permease [Saccharofermentanales bacterium]
MIRIAKKNDLSSIKANILRVSSIVLALLASGLMLYFMGFNPLKTFRAMVEGSLGSAYGIKNSINIAIPYLIIALGISVAFSMKYWNIGAEGQLVIGAVFATYVTRVMPPDTNGAVLIIMMAAAGMLGGAIWAVIPGLFKAFSNTNETLFTLMMNYIAIKITLYLRAILWKDPASMGFPKIASIPVQARLPKIFGIHAGWIIAIVVAILIFIFLKYTKKGYETKVVGESENTAHYAGMNVKKVLITGVVISGALAGLAGMVKLNGMSYSLSEAIGGGDGFTAIIIAWLSRLSAPVMAIVALLFAAMRQGAMSVELRMGIPSSVTEIIQGVILFFALGSEFFIRYKIVYDRKKESSYEIESIADGGTIDER